MTHPLDHILKAQKHGIPAGIPSLCSAHPWVLKTALQGDAPVLVESTCNQVNQEGGYTGMRPADFSAYVQRLAFENHFPTEHLILGGDHLGPSPWQDQPAEAAMSRAHAMVQAYISAGYTKIHLDASMKLADDASASLDIELAARRTACLARTAEQSLPQVPGPFREIRYVIGTEVPVPGGSTAHEDRVKVTTVEDARRTLEVFQTAFIKEGLEDAWQRVMALVVQPGVEFGDDFVLEYEPEAARSLARFIETTPFIFEAHSTDYQTPKALQMLVRDHFAILKVGPALTFAFREAVFSLAAIERELVAKEEASKMIETIDAIMLAEPLHWQQYYRGTQQEQAIARRFSLSDRIRYYWPNPVAQRALEKLLVNLSTTPMPLSLISQFLPEAYTAIRNGKLQNFPVNIISYKIKSVLEDYSSACAGARL